MVRRFNPHDEDLDDVQSVIATSRATAAALARRRESENATRSLFRGVRPAFRTVRLSSYLASHLRSPISEADQMIFYGRRDRQYVPKSRSLSKSYVLVVEAMAHDSSSSDEGKSDYFKTLASRCLDQVARYFEFYTYSDSMLKAYFSTLDFETLETLSKYASTMGTLRDSNVGLLMSPLVETLRLEGTDAFPLTEEGLSSLLPAHGDSGGEGGTRDSYESRDGRFHDDTAHNDDDDWEKHWEQHGSTGQFVGCVSLTSLDLAFAKVSLAFLSRLASSLPTLVHLGLSNCLTAFDAPEVFTRVVPRFTALRSLDLHDSDWLTDGVIIEFVEVLRSRSSGVPVNASGGGVVEAGGSSGVSSGEQKEELLQHNSAVLPWTVSKLEVVDVRGCGAITYVGIDQLLRLPGLRRNTKVGLRGGLEAVEAHNSQDAYNLLVGGGVAATTTTPATGGRRRGGAAAAGGGVVWG